MTVTQSMHAHTQYFESFVIVAGFWYNKPCDIDELSHLHKLRM